MHGVTLAGFATTARVATGPQRSTYAAIASIAADVQARSAPAIPAR